MTFANDKAKAQADAATLAADLAKANADAATLSADIAAITQDPIASAAYSVSNVVITSPARGVLKATFVLPASPVPVSLDYGRDGVEAGGGSPNWSGNQAPAPTSVQFNNLADSTLYHLTFTPKADGVVGVPVTVPGTTAPAPVVSGGDPTPTQSLLWTGAAGTFPTNVVPELGGNGWGNGELETYTNRAVNAHCDGAGNLVIVARPEKFTGADGITRNFTSARLNTTKSLQIQPGSYFECAAILPPNGWSAFWTIGMNALQGVPWPDNGEVDIVEIDAGHAKTNIHTTNNNQPGWGYPGSDTGPVDGKTRVKYGCYFDGTVIKFYRDRKLTSQWTAQQAAALGAKWPFNQPIYCIFNVAVSGGDTGFTGATATFGPVNAWKGTLPTLVGG